MNPEHPVDWPNVEATLDAGKRWMNRPQKDGVIMQHHGIGNYVGGGMHITFAPHPPRGEVGRRAKVDKAVTIIIIDLSDIYTPYEWDEDGKYAGGHELVAKVGGFDQETKDRLRSMIDARFKVVDEWNGSIGTQTWSICVLGGGHAAKAVANYFNHCPKPGHSVFCGQRETWSWKEGYEPTEAEREKAECTWWKDGRGKLVEPQWVASVDRLPAPEPDLASEDERLAELLDAVRPLLVKMDFHAQLVSASSAGEIEGESPKRIFVPGDHRLRGIQLPAESFAELVRLAVIGYELEEM